MNISVPTDMDAVDSSSSTQDSASPDFFFADEQEATDILPQISAWLWAEDSSWESKLQVLVQLPAASYMVPSAAVARPSPSPCTTSTTSSASSRRAKRRRTTQSRPAQSGSETSLPAAEDLPCRPSGGAAVRTMVVHKPAALSVPAFQ